MADKLAALTQPQPSVLDGLKTLDTMTGDTMDPSYADKVARMAAVGEGDVQDVEARTQHYRQVIQQSGDDALRTAAAARQQKEKIDGLIGLFRNPDPSVDPDGTLASAAHELAVRTISEDLEKQKKDALERQAIKRIQDLAASGDTTQANIYLNNLELGSPEDIVADFTTKKLILEREIEKAKIAKEDQGWFLDLADFAMKFLPLNVSMGESGNVDYPGMTKGWLDGLFAGQRLNTERAGLWNLPADQFSDYVKDHLIPNIRENSTLLGFHDRSEELDLWTKMYNTPTNLETNLWGTVDNLGGVGVGSLSKGTLKIGSLMVRNGARREASMLTAQAIKIGERDGIKAMAERTGMDADEVASNSLPSAVNPDPTTTIPLTGQTQAALDRADELLKMLPETLPSDRFVDEAEFQKALETATKRIAESHRRPLVDVKPETITTPTGTRFTQLEITLGTKEGNGFATQVGANRALSQTGMVGEIVRDESGQWFYKVKHNMLETGFYDYELNPNHGKVLGLALDNPIANTIVNSRLLGDEFLANLAQHSGNRVAKVLKSVVKPAADQLAKLPKNEKADLAQVMMKGEKDATWYTVDELEVLYQRAYKRSPTQRELDAYQAVQDYNNIEYGIRNDDMYINKVIKGLETATVDLGENLGLVERRNAFVDRLMNTPPKTRVYNVRDGIHYTKDNPLTQEVLDKLKSEGFVIVEYEQGIKINGAKVKAFAVKAKDAKFEPLRRDQLPYRAGGHRFYTTKYFSKQTVKGVQADTLEEYLDNPLTHMTGTKAEVDWWNGRMEAARQVYKAALDEGREVAPEALDEVLGGGKGLPTGEEFISKMETGEFSKDTPFLTMFDRELPPEYVNVSPEKLDFVEEETGFNGFLRTQGRMYYSKKGEQLRDWRGDAAPVLDPFESINKSLKNIASMSSFTDYKVTAVERWAKTYKKYLTGYNAGDSDMTIFANAQFNKNSQFARIRQSAEKQRQIIKRTLGWKTDNDLAAEQIGRQLTEWINGSNPEGVRNLVANKWTNWWDNNNPVAALRSLAFDMKLGLFNPAQLLLQASTTLASLSLSPKHGRPAVMNWLFMFQYMSKSGTEHYLDELVNRGIHKLAGFSDPKEYKTFMKSMKKSGFLDLGGSHGLIQNWGVDASASRTGNLVQHVRDWGRILFNQGEVANRSVAMQIAWKETREKFPELATDSPQFLRAWQGRAEDYSFGMSSQTSAWWQQGVMSIPTQFWAYQMRMLEAMLGNTFTPSQRLRLAMGQFILYGSAGLPVVPLISDKIKGSTGEAPDVGTFMGLLDRGFLDNMAYAAFGQDVQIGKRLGTGPWLTDTIKDFAGMSEYGEKSFVDLIGGATGGTLMDFMGTLGAGFKDVLRHTAAESGGDIGEPISREAVIRLASNISSLSAAHRAWLVWNYNKWETNKGLVLADDIPSGTAFFTLLFGAQPGQLDQLSAMREFLGNKSKQVDEAAKTIEMYRVKSLTEPDRAREYAQEINLYVRMLPPDIRQKALAKAHRNIDPSLYKSYAERLDRQRQQEQTIKQLEQGQ